jgi:dihydrofolate reductase
MKVTLVAAISLDGYINRALDSPIDFTSPEDKKFFFSECARTGVAIMGANTHANHKQPIPNCLNIVMTKDALSAQRAEGRVMPTTRSFLWSIQVTALG